MWKVNWKSSPYGTTVSCLQKQCRDIEKELGL